MAPRKLTVKDEHVAMILNEIGQEPISIDELYNKVAAKIKGEKVARKLVYTALQKLMKLKIVTCNKVTYCVNPITTCMDVPRRGRKPRKYGRVKEKKNKKKNVKNVAKKIAKKIGKKHKKKQSKAKKQKNNLASPCQIKQFLDEGVKCGTLDKYKNFYYVIEQSKPVGKKHQYDDDKEFEDLDSMNSMDIEEANAKGVNACVNEMDDDLANQNVESQADVSMANEAQFIDQSDSTTTVSTDKRVSSRLDSANDELASATTGIGTDSLASSRLHSTNVELAERDDDEVNRPKSADDERSFCVIQ